MNGNYRAQGVARDATASTSDLLKMTAIFAQASQGNLAIHDMLRQTAHLTRADVVSISRVDLSCEQGSAKVLSCDGSLQQRKQLGKIDVSFSPAFFGAELAHAKLGSVWFGQLSDLEDHHMLTNVYRRAQLASTACILLDRQYSSADVLELHFGYSAKTSQADNFGVVAPVLSDCWKKRALGRFSEAKLAAPEIKPSKTASRSILSLENPCKLSRAEYRVCALLARGLNNKALISELSVTMATLRTHLRNIYAKTGAESQSELVHALLTPLRETQFKESSYAI